MTVLPPNQFVSDSGAMYATPDEAVVSFAPEAHTDTTADLSLIAEIFIGAAKLSEGRFKLDEESFMLELEEPPLFLRRAG